jgi:hypothetical protein
MNKTYALAATLFLSALTVLAGQTQYAVIVVVDGARYTETFGDPTHTYIPRMWTTLKPQGTLYTNFRNNGYTETCPGHSAIVTGAWQNIANDGSERPHTPTIFEYYRKEDGAPAKDNYVVLGKTKLGILQYSDYTGYGTTYGASKSNASPESADKPATDSVKAVLARHPRMLIVNLPAVDYAGHAGNYTNYLSAIRAADSLVNVIWTTIQADPVLANKTTLFITNDHGRHTTSFSSHGDGCEGCRHIMLLVLGPDTPVDSTDAATYQQIDIAPTIGGMLGFSLPQATGSAIASATSRSQNQAPVASGVAITGSPVVGQMLTVNYTFSDAEGDVEGVSTFRWLRNNSAIVGATSRNYTLTGADQSATIKAEVTPVAVTGTSPGTPVQSTGVGPVTAPPFVLANVKVYLEGPYASDTMSTALRAGGYLPLSQPYGGSPWSYVGSEAVANIPAGVVDWVIVELRSDTSTAVAKRAAFLKSNGMLTDTNGTNGVTFGGVSTGSYYVVVRHRNHLAVMSAAKVALNGSSPLYDFTTGLAQFYGGDAKEVATGKFGMWGGDVDGSGDVAVTDRSATWNGRNGVGYDGADVNLSGDVAAVDRSLTWNNRNKFSMVH